MRASVFSGLAVLATSLLVKDVIGGPLRKRDYVVDNVLITEMVTVFQNPDGSLSTADNAIPVSTATSLGTSIVESATSVVVSSSTPDATPSVPSVSSSQAVSSLEGSPSASAAPSTATAVADKAAAVPEESPIVAIEKASSKPAVLPTTLSKVAAASTTSIPVSKPSASTSPSTGSSGDKRGLAYNDPTLLTSFTTIAGAKTNWAYNWGSSPGGTIPAGLEFVPMLWGLRSEDTTGWKAAATSAIKSGSTHLLAMNEPDLGTQSNISPPVAAQGYIDNMQQFSSASVKLVSPAITNGPITSGMGVAWLGDFLTHCGNLKCTIDAIALHWYGEATNFADFKQHVSDVYAAGGGRPLWITEFQGFGSTADQQAFLAQALPFLDSLSYVERYAYFMVAQDNLVSGNTVSALGKTFATAA